MGARPLSALRAKCPDCRTLTAVAIGPEYQCHSCGREFAAGLVRVGDVPFELPWPEAAAVESFEEIGGNLPQYLLNHQTISDRTWTDQPRLKSEKRNAFITARNDNATNSGKIQIGTASAGTLSINLTIDHFGNFVAAGTAPTVASTGTGSSPTNTVDTGDNDFVGTITVTAGTAPSSSGTVTLTFAGTLGTNAPVCQWTLGNGTGTFNARATAINGTQSTSSSVVNWDNNAVNLTATSTYKFNYNCTGK